MKHEKAMRFGICLSCALLLQMLMLLAPRPASAQEAGESQQGSRSASAHPTAAESPVVVLKDGSRLEPQSIRRQRGEIVLRYADGRLESYPEQDVDLASSRGVPAAAPRPSGPRLSRPKGPQSLGQIASAKSISLPDPNAPQLADLPSVNLGEEDPEKGPSSSRRKKPSEEEEASQELKALQADIRDLEIELLALGVLLAEVQEDCSGHTAARRSCGRGFVVSKQDTAACQDAIRRARGRLAPLESQYSALWSNARRNGLEPGKVRQVIGEAGLNGFRDTLDAVSARLDALSE